MHRQPPKAEGPNKVWAVDFQFDVTTDARPIKIASIVDEHAVSARATSSSATSLVTWSSTSWTGSPPCVATRPCCNSRIRDECLNINIFWSVAQARVVVGAWKQDYNHHRRRSSLGYLAPAEYAAACVYR